MNMSQQDVVPESGIQILQPAGWAAPRGYSNGIAARGRTVVVGGQIGWDSQCRFHSSDFAEQARQALQNIVDVLAEAGGKPEHIVRMTWYVVEKADYLTALRETGAIWRDLIGPHYPAMAVVVVKGLIEDAARIEIETTAVVGPPGTDQPALAPSQTIRSSMP